MCKDMNNIHSTIKVIAQGYHIKFSCNAGSVYSRNVRFGEFDDSDDEADLIDQIEYEEDFDTEQLTRITKIAGLSANMKIYPKKNLPLLFRSQVGSIGNISIYVKSKSLIEADKQNNED